MIRQIRRTLVFLLGIFIMSFGLAVSIRANLGTSPIASFPTVLSLGTTPSVGFYLLAVNLLFLVLQILLVGRKFPLFQLVQIPVSIIFGVFTDLSLYLTTWLEPSNYLLQWAWTLGGVVLVALGVYLETQPRLSYIPGDGLVFALTLKLQNIPFGTIKLVFDWTLVVMAVVTSLLLLGHLEGVREGTAFAALTVGPVIRLIGLVHKRLDK
ncbi:MAG: YczE/YyaS/YitT family protein [Yaniella sp.]|uniref:YczE/YyaS/YitT family protein n=1 Tax=Yaniella sp. TaxID=2773929 RepID=UPI002647D4F4|nr:DUF6198 family protein [Yaniella sp.]